MSSEYSSNDEFEVRSIKDIIKKENKKIENYDVIKQKTLFIKTNTVSELIDEPLYNKKVIDISQFRRNTSFKQAGSNKLVLKLSIIDEINNKNKEKIKEIHNISSKIENLIYSKINILDFNHFTQKYYSSNAFNLLSYKKLRKFKNMASDIILKNIYYEYHNKNNIIKFYSNFELGNLNLVYKNFNSVNEFDLIISSDKNIQLSTGWFYFKMTGITRGQKIKLNIINLVRNKSLYDKKKIAIKSVNLNMGTEKTLNDWKYLGDNVTFKKCKNNEFYILSFEYTMRYDKEIVYFAENIPYDLNQNQKFLDSWLVTNNDLLNIKINTFNFTNTNYKNYYISVTSKNKIKMKPVIVLLSRIQPSHNCSSYVLEGMIKYLFKLENVCIEYLLDNYELIIIPFLSFEMVIFGNTRHTLAGLNLTDCDNNEVYKSQEFHSLKNLLTTIKKRAEIKMIFEIHDNPFKYNYYFHIFSHNEDKIELKEYNNFLNIMNYNMNFLKKDKTVIIKENKKFMYFRKKFDIKYLFQFYISSYGNENNEIEFMPIDYIKLGRNIAYSLSLFFAKTTHDNNKNQAMKSIIFEIDDYFKNINSEEKELVFKRNDSFGSNDNFFLNNKKEMQYNSLIDRINVNDMLDEDWVQENNYQKKLISKYIIKHKRDFRTKYFDYVIKRDKKNFQVKLIKDNNQANNIITKNIKTKIKKIQVNKIKPSLKSDNNIINFNLTISNNFNYINKVSKRKNGKLNTNITSNNLNNQNNSKVQYNQLHQTNQDFLTQSHKNLNFKLPNWKINIKKKDLNIDMNKIKNSVKKVMKMNNAKKKIKDNKIQNSYKINNSLKRKIIRFNKI